MKLHIETDAFAGQRFDDLLIETGYTKMNCAGLLTLFWKESQGREMVIVTQEEIESCLPVPRSDRRMVFDALLACRYISRFEGAGVLAFEIRGNKKHVEALARYKEMGKIGGQKSAAKRKEAQESQAPALKEATISSVKTKPTVEKIEPRSDQFRSDQISTDQIGEEEDLIPSGESAAPSAPAIKQTEVNRKAWDAYIAAYKKRHNVEPTRNKTVNAQMANFVRRVGGADAPGIAEFYVGHNDFLYVKSQHPISLMLRDAEGLRTQWLNRRAVTSADARQVEKTDRFRSQLERIQAGKV